MSFEIKDREDADWMKSCQMARLLAYVTGLVNQELLVSSKNEKHCEMKSLAERNEADVTGVNGAFGRRSPADITLLRILFGPLRPTIMKSPQPPSMI